MHNSLSRNGSGLRHIVVVGAGITGLAAGYRAIQEGARLALPLKVTVLERSNRAGGKLFTDRENGYTIEAGAETFVTRKPALLALIRELGLEHRIMGLNPGKLEYFIYRKGQRIALPAGLSFFVPTDLWALMRSPLLSPLGRLRVLMDLFIPANKDYSQDESVAELVSRRLGREAMELLAEPLFLSAFMTDVERLSMRDLLPTIVVAERTYGSLIRGMQAAAALNQQTDPIGPLLPGLLAFRGGMVELVDALARKLGRSLRLNATVSDLTRREDGWELWVNGTERIFADALIVTTPSFVAADLLESALPEAPSLLEQIHYGDIGAAALMYDQSAISTPLNGTGMAVARSAQRWIDSMSWSSSAWANRAPEGKVLIRAFFGGPATRASFLLDDETLRRALLQEMSDLLNIKAPPEDVKIYRWSSAYPLYEAGHFALIAQIASLLPDGLYLAGAAYRGVGVDDCITQGYEAGQMAAALVCSLLSDTPTQPERVQLMRRYTSQMRLVDLSQDETTPVDTANDAKSEAASD